MAHPLAALHDERYGRRMLDVHRLRTFRTVAAAGSLQAAAVQLSLTPSAVSKLAARLERRLGMPLFSRSSLLSVPGRV